MALTTAFAKNGNKKAVPQTTQDGSVSYDQGFGNLYALPPEEGGLFIDRAQFNQIMFDTTSAVISNQNSITTLNSKVTANQNSINTLNSKVAGLESSVSTGVVNLTGNQTIAGTKTFSSPVVVPDATADTHAVNLAQLHTKANWNTVVNLTGNQTIAGVKTFSAVPVVATQPTNANQVANKAYVDSKLGKAYITETYTNGASWYRVWSDGFCEQGGTIDTCNKTITFLKPFKDTNYTLVGVAFVIGDIGRQSVTKYVNKFVTGSEMRASGTSSWYACGYIA